MRLPIASRQTPRVAVSVLFIYLSLPPTLAQALDVYANPAQIAELLQQEGYLAKIENRGEDNIFISSKSEGLTWIVDFYGCVKRKNCSSIQFTTGFTFDKKAKPTLEKLNSWNRDKRYVAAYADTDGDPHLFYDINLAEGISETTFKKSLDTWTTILGNFAKYIGYN